MPSDTPAAEPPQLSAAALAEWTTVVENVLRGLAHALNNRATALSAVIELSRDVADDPSVTRSILGTELQRVRDLVNVLRSVSVPRRGVEAFAARDAADEALSVLQLHAEQRDRAVAIDAAGAPPLRTARWMFVRSLIALGVAAGAYVEDTSAPVRIAVVEDGDWAVVQVDGVRSTTTPLSLYAAELASAMGGEALQTNTGFRVPSLGALRRRGGR